MSDTPKRTITLVHSDSSPETQDKSRPKIMDTSNMAANVQQLMHDTQDMKSETDSIAGLKDICHSTQATVALIHESIATLVSEAKSQHGRCDNIEVKLGLYKQEN